MKIQPVSQSIINRDYNVSNHKNTKIENNYQTDLFQPSFCGYENMLKEIIETDFKHMTHVEDAFENLFNMIKENPNLTVTPQFEFLSEKFREPRLRQILEFLSSPKPNEKFAELKRSDIVLAIDDKIPVFEISNYGRHCMFNDSLSAPYNIELIFANKEKDLFLSFCKTKKGDYILEQITDEDFKHTIFYKSNGRIKHMQYEYSNGDIDNIYYNKDGSPDFWRNVFLSIVSLLK